MARDLKAVLGDFNASRAMQDYKVSQCSAPGEAVPQMRTLHRYSWISNDGHTQKEIDHVLLSRGNAAHQCRVYCRLAASTSTLTTTQ